MSYEIVFGSGTLTVDDGALHTGEQYAPVAEDNTVGVIKNEERYLSSRKTADGQVLATAGKLHSISISPNTGSVTAGVLTIYDSLTETGTILWSGYIPTTLVNFSWTPDFIVANGIYVGFDGTLANVAVHISYRGATMA